MAKKWTEKELNALFQLCLEGVSNKDIAAHFKCESKDVHAARSKQHWTIKDIEVIKQDDHVQAEPSAARQAAQREQREQYKEKRRAQREEHVQPWDVDTAFIGLLNTIEASVQNKSRRNQHAFYSALYLAVNGIYKLFLSEFQK